MKQLNLEQVAIKARGEEFHILKMIEECAEATELLVKMLTKSGDNKPDLKKVAEELGDVIVRGKILGECLELTEDINKRVEEKSKLLHDHYTADLERRGL